MNLLKYLVCLSVVLMSCNKIADSRTCPLCGSAAVVLVLFDSLQKNRIDSAMVVWKSSTYTDLDTVDLEYSPEYLQDTVYVVPGLPGDYTVSIIRNEYDTINLNITVGPYSGYSCEYSDTKILKIEMRKTALYKSRETTLERYRIVEERTEPTCG